MNSRLNRLFSDQITLMKNSERVMKLIMPTKCGVLTNGSARSQNALTGSFNVIGPNLKLISGPLGPPYWLRATCLNPRYPNQCWAFGVDEVDDRQTIRHRTHFGFLFRFLVLKFINCKPINRVESKVVKEWEFQRSLPPSF